MPRLFVAVDLPPGATDRLAAIQPSALPGVRVVDRDQMHLTLHFLGEVDAARAAAVAEALSSVRGDPFTITLRGVGQFPPQGEPEFLWVGVCNSPPLYDLRHAVGMSLAAVGIVLEDRPYSPHVTLAKVTTPSPAEVLDQYLEAHRDVSVGSFPVRQFNLYSSVLTEGVPTYRRERSFLLGNAADAC
jgi:2'-5' RNA ligase